MFGRGTQAGAGGRLTQHHIRVQGEETDQDGCLIYLGDQVVSLLIRLQPGTAAMPEQRHKWQVVETYGPGRALSRAPLFDTPDAVIAWIADRLPRPAPPPWLDAHLLP